MKGLFFKYFLSLIILLFSICSPALAYSNTSGSSFYHHTQSVTPGNTDFYVALQNKNTHVKGSLGDNNKSLEIDAAEIEEEEESSLLKIEGSKFNSTSFYLLSLLFLFSYLLKSKNLQKLLSFIHLSDRRFVLFQVFRL
ncbi:hypothetical protein ACNR9Q_02470 [Maribacter sp. X9]|uniref:hypothetical protein n=1 Tax=Maribacter sp. X9 TaxID=3402159 RepID=UPI003AF333F4